jgi:pimeloyl-ACP methyl ester carboxylesterase
MTEPLSERQGEAEEPIHSFRSQRSAGAARDSAEMESPRYARSDGHHLAYRVRDSSEPRDIVLFTPGGTVPMDFLGRDRVGARLLDGLTALGRLVLFDRRGIGLSDPITDWSRPLVEQWADDLATIVKTPPLSG